LGVKLSKRKYNLKEGHFDKPKLAVHAFEEGHKTDRTQAPVLQIELLLGNIKKRLTSFVRFEHCKNIQIPFGCC
jgi:hypothetical protein